MQRHPQRRAAPPPGVDRAPSGRSTLGTLRSRAEAWDQPCAEPAVCDRHGPIVWVVAGSRLALVHDLDE